MSDAHHKLFSVTAIINGVTFRKRTNDIAETLLTLKPDFVLTDMYVTVKKDTQKSERRLTPPQARKLFNDPIFREVFMNNLLLS